MKKRVGILTSGGDCPGLNATIRGVAKALYARMGDNVEIVGILNGYSGLINGDYKEMSEDDFRGILTLGGTILGTKRTPFKMMRVVEDDNVDKVAAMKKTYKDAKLDCLLCLGGNGTHKTANLLSQEGLNIIGMTKTVAKELGARNVTVNAVAPGFIKTPMTDALTEEQRNKMLELVAMKRYGEPEEVANVISFLCSDDASYVTGQTIEISGGLMM